MSLVGPADPAIPDDGSEAALDMPGSAPEWWTELYERRYVATARLAGLIVGDFAAGEDIAQDAFARLYEARSKVRDPDRYLTGTVLNQCRSSIRRTSRARALIGRLGQPEAVSFEAVLTERSAFLDTLSGLPLRQREAVVLRFYGGLSEIETAEAMKISVNSAKTHVRRGIGKLTEHLEALS